MVQGMTQRRSSAVLDSRQRRPLEEKSVRTEIEIMRKTQTGIWGEGVPGKGNSKSESPEVGRVLEYSGDRIGSSVA